MPRPMLKTPQQKTENSGLLSIDLMGNKERKKQQQMNDKIVVEKLLRQKRSKKYMEALCSLDAGGHTHNQQKVNEIIDAIKEEFPEVELSGILLGFVSKCYLGAPYEVHTLDWDGGIVEHYKSGCSLPNGMENARAIALRGGYVFIEVYTDCCRAVSSNGAVSVIPT